MRRKQRERNLIEGDIGNVKEHYGLSGIRYHYLRRQRDVGQVVLPGQESEDRLGPGVIVGKVNSKYGIRRVSSRVILNAKNLFSADPNYELVLKSKLR